VRRRVRAVIEAELALIAEIDHFLDVGGRELVDIAVDRLHVHAVEQHLERRTQRQAPPAPPTNVIAPPQLLINRSQIPKLRTLDIERSHDYDRTEALRYRTGSRWAGVGVVGPVPAERRRTTRVQMEPSRRGAAQKGRVVPRPPPAPPPTASPS